MRNIVLSWIMFVSLMSCKDDGVHPVAIEDGMYVIDRHGLVENYAPDFSKIRYTCT